MTEIDLEQGVVYGYNNHRRSFVGSDVSVYYTDGEEEEEEVDVTSCYSYFYSTNGGGTTYEYEGGGDESRKVSSVSASSSVIDIDEDETAETEKDCRICHLGVGGGGAMELGCSCKDDLAVAHRQCAETWFKIKGDNPSKFSTSDDVDGGFRGQNWAIRWLNRQLGPRMQLKEMVVELVGAFNQVTARMNAVWLSHSLLSSLIFRGGRTVLDLFDDGLDRGYWMTAAQKSPLRSRRAGGSTMTVDLVDGGSPHQPLCGGSSLTSLGCYGGLFQDGVGLGGLGYPSPAVWLRPIPDRG